MQALMMTLAFLIFDGPGDAMPRDAVCPFDATAVFCSEDDKKTLCCPGDTPLCCAGGKMGCCPSDKPWSCNSPRQCYATVEETAGCSGLVSQCN